MSRIKSLSTVDVRLDELFARMNVGDDTSARLIFAHLHRIATQIARRLANSPLFAENLDHEHLGFDLASKAHLGLMRTFDGAMPPTGVLVSHVVRTMHNALIDEVRTRKARESVNVRIAPSHAPDSDEEPLAFANRSPDPHIEASLEAPSARIDALIACDRMLATMVDMLAPPARTFATVRDLVGAVLWQCARPEERDHVLATLRDSGVSPIATTRSKEACSLLLRLLETSDAEIAAIIDVAPSSVSTYVKRARAILAKAACIDLQLDAPRARRSARAVRPTRPPVRLRYLLLDRSARVCELQQRALLADPRALLPADRQRLLRAALADARLSWRVLANWSAMMS